MVAPVALLLLRQPAFERPYTDVAENGEELCMFGNSQLGREENGPAQKRTESVSRTSAGDEQRSISWMPVDQPVATRAIGVPESIRAWWYQKLLT